MSKLKTAIEEKDWLTAKRLILDNPEYLEENVDLVLGMIERLDKLKTEYQMVGRGIRSEKINIIPTPWQKSKRGDSPFMNWKHDPARLFKPEDLDYLKQMVKNPREFKQRYLGEWEPIEETEEERNERIWSQYQYKRTENRQERFWMTSPLPSMNIKWKREDNKELAHEQALSVNEFKDGMKKSCRKIMTDSIRIGDRLKGFGFDQIIIDDTIPKGELQLIGEKNAVKIIGIDKGSPEGDKHCESVWEWAGVKPVITSLSFTVDKSGGKISEPKSAPKFKITNPWEDSE
jgi:hypothetical protein